ncbi:MAG: hypothetical protein HZA22_06265 [Nitrospirae bacterium]|nr:hypothetical protein [Nitrospirota bacterium]MBI5695683.1 hypothetical protein [Nitrospirota bacterium]
MGLLNFEKQEIAQAIIKKLRIKLRKGKERNGWYFLDGVPVLRVTIPHGNGNITPGTVNSIINETRLNKEQFRDLIKCPLSAKDYEEIIRDKGLA